MPVREVCLSRSGSRIIAAPIAGATEVMDRLNAFIKGVEAAFEAYFVQDPGASFIAAEEFFRPAPFEAPLDIRFIPKESVGSRERTLTAESGGDPDANSG